MARRKPRHGYTRRRCAGMTLAGAGLALIAGAVVSALPIAPAEANPLLSEDFEAFDSGAQPGVEQLGVDDIGSGACARFSAGGSRASGKALCGAGTRSTGGDPDPFDALVFGDPGGFHGALKIDLSLAAFETGMLDGPLDPPDLFDFVDIRLGGETVVQFYGVNTRTSEQDGFRLGEAAGPYRGPELVPADADDPEAGRFFDFSFFVGPDPAGRPRDLMIAIGLTGKNEFAAIDSLNVTAIPAPAALGLFGLGLIGLGLGRRRRSITA